MPMQFKCDVPGFEENWIEVSDKWKRSETEVVERARAYGDFLPIFYQKVTACHLLVEEELTLNDPKEVTAETIERMDEVLASFVGSVLVHAAARRRALGNMSARISSDTSGKAKQIDAR